jgi:hypothetical protein
MQATPRLRGQGPYGHVIPDVRPSKSIGQQFVFKEAGNSQGVAQPRNAMQQHFIGGVKSRQVQPEPVNSVPERQSLVALGYALPGDICFIVHASITPPSAILFHNVFTFQRRPVVIFVQYFLIFVPGR